MQVDGAALVAVGLAEALEERVRCAGLNPAMVRAGAPPCAVAPPADSDDRAALDGQAAFLNVAVNGGGGETPQGYVLQGGLPAAPQGRRDRDLAGGLVEQSEVAVAALHRRVGGQADRREHGFRQVVQGRERAPERRG